MNVTNEHTTRRKFLGTVTATSAGLVVCNALQAAELPKSPAGTFDKAQIAITLDLEMSRNFPKWENTNWDYEKGNLNQAAKDYTVAACRRVRKRGGVIHNFVVGQVFEHSNIDWLKEISQEGHPIGNHTYDHVYLLASSTEELQYRFRRAPWLLRGRSVHDVLRDNIKLTNLALKQRVGVEANGFRTPGGFATGLNGREDIQQLILDLGFDWISCRYPAHAGIESLHGTERKPLQAAYDNIHAAQSEAQPFVYPTGLLEIPMSPISDIGAFRGGRWKLEYFLKAIRQSMQWAIENRAVFDFLSHPSCLGVVDPGFQAIDLICDLVDQADGRAEIVSLDTIAERSRHSLAR
ncbi:MAG: polysaccharide deacetylase family protein [Pirellulales bacterium]